MGYGRSGGGASAQLWARVADHADLDASTALSISIWLRYDGIIGVPPPILTKSPTDTLPAWAYSLTGDSGSVNSQHLTFGVNIAGVQQTLVSNTTFPATTWMHWLCVYDNVGLYIYRNGALDAFRLQTGNIVVDPASDNDLYLFHYHGISLFNIWQGYIAELAIWKDIALNASHALQLSRGIRPIAIDGPMPTRYWDMIRTYHDVVFGYTEENDQVANQTLIKEEFAQVFVFDTHPPVVFASPQLAITEGNDGVFNEPDYPAPPSRPVMTDSTKIYNFNGVETTVLTGLEHLEGELVCVVRDGFCDEGTYVVTDGQITLTTSAFWRADVGKCYTAELWTMEPAIDGHVTKGLPRHWPITQLRLYKSHGGEVKIGTSLDWLPIRTGDRSYPTNLTGDQLFTGDVDRRSYGETELDGRVKIRSAGPCLFTLLAIFGEVEFGEKF